MSSTKIVRFEDVKRSIIRVRETDVILDNDVAELYGVETKRVNEAVRNNPNKFPTGYILELEKEEWDALKKAFDIANEANFTEQELELQHRKKDWVYMQKSSLDLAKSQGVKQGMEQGIEQGIEQGVEQHKKEVVIKSYRAGLDRQLIQQITGLNEEKIDEM